MTIDVENATRDELIAYAKDVKGMDVPPKIRTETLRVKLGGAPAVKVPAPDAPDAPAKVRILIQASDEDGGGDDVYLCVNGRNCIIQRGEEVEIEPHFVEVLNNANKTVYRTVRDRANGKQHLQAREVLAYPFTIIK